MPGMPESPIPHLIFSQYQINFRAFRKICLKFNAISSDMNKSEKHMVQGSTIKIRRGWEKVAAISAFGAAVMLAPLGPSAKAGGVVAHSDKGQSKVTICHKGVTITIARAALDAHLAHGDRVGACVITP